MTDTSTSAVEALAYDLGCNGNELGKQAAATLRALLAEREILTVERGNLLSIIQRDNATLAEMRREAERLATEGRA